MKIRAMRAVLMLATTISASRAVARDEVADPRLDTIVTITRSNPTPRPGHRSIPPEETMVGGRIKKVDGVWLKISHYFGTYWVREDETVPSNQALDFFTRKLEVSPDDPDLLIRQGRALGVLGRVHDAEALAKFNRAIELAPKKAYLFYARSSRWLWPQQDHGRAMEDINQAIALDPTNAIYLADRAGISRSQKDFNRAIVDLTEAIRLDPTRPSHYSARAFNWGELGKDDLALADFTEAVRLDTEDTASLGRRAWFFQRKQQFELAIPDYDEIIRRERTFHFTYGMRASARMAQKKYDLAIEDYSQCIRRLPSDPTYNPYRASQISQRAFAHGQVGAYDRALADAAAAMRLMPKNANYRNSHGYYHLQLGNLDAALKDFDEALRIAPKNVAALENKAWMLAGHPVDARRDGKEALRLVTVAQELGRENAPENLSTRAAAHAELGDFDEAIRCQELAIKALPDDDNRKDFYQGCLDHYRNKQPHRLPAAPADKAG